MDTPETIGAGHRILPPTRMQLLELARRAAKIAYCPYSRFRVGAAVFAEGEIFTGCNVENASLGLTICAERTAVLHAVAAGKRRLSAIAVSCPDAGPELGPRMPCGACRQLLAEFGTCQTVVFVDAVGDYDLSGLLPDAFSYVAHSPIPDVQANVRPRLCVDIDNVVADSDTLMRQLIHAHSKEAVSLEYLDVLTFDYRKCVDVHGKRLETAEVDEWHAIHEVFSQQVSSIEPYPGVQDILLELSSVFDIHLVTSRLPSARAGTIEWLQRNRFPETLRLHFVRSGEKHLSFARYFASIEDDGDQAVAFALSGIHSVVLAHPWNARCEGIEMTHRCVDWIQVRDVLLQLSRW